MDSRSFDVLVRLVESFWDKGWVDGLTSDQYGMLNEANDYIEKMSVSSKCRNLQVKIASQLRSEGYSIREIAGTLGYINPGSVTCLLEQNKNKK